MNGQLDTQKHIDALRDDPDVYCVIVWTRQDCEAISVDPETVNWSNVENLSIERGWDAIDA